MLMRSGKGAPITPLDAAMHKGNSAVAKFLQLHGGLPSNSLNDSSLQRRLNRYVKSAIVMFVIKIKNMMEIRCSIPYIIFPHPLISCAMIKL